MLKQLFDVSEKKGEQNNLVALSKNYGDTSAIISSGVEYSIQDLVEPFGQDGTRIFGSNFKSNSSPIYF
jgi:hypothetical protein